MKFKSTQVNADTGVVEDTHVALTTGHTVVITAEGNEIESRFHKEAIAAGCVPIGLSEDDASESTSKGFNRKERIRECLNAMMDGNDPEDFTAVGRPNINRLKALVGFNFDRAEADAIWDELSTPKV